MALMIIKQVHIDGFGKWHDQDFNFDDNRQIIYGPNEAGKTTLTKFICGVLFGFADGRGKNRYSQYIPKNGNSYGGSILLVQHGVTYRVKRSKGKNGGKVTVTAENGAHGGEEMLNEILGVMDESLYCDLFSFNQRDLAAVEELDKEKWQQNLQQVGTVGSRQWSSLISTLIQQADRLYKPRGRKWPLNQDLYRYDRLSTKLAQAKDRHDEYLRLNNQLAQTVTAQQADQQKLDKCKKEVAKLERLQQLWPVYEEWQRKGKDHRKPVTELTNNQVLAAQELQARERVVHQQRLTCQQQLSTVSPQLPGHLIGKAQGELSALMELKKQVIQLQAQLDYQQTSERQAKKWQEELVAIERRYHHQPLPAPLTANDQLELARLQQSSTNSKFELSRSQLAVMIMGFSLFILGLLINKNLLTILGTLIMAGTVGVVYQQRDQHFTKPSANQLATFGKEHGLAPFSVSQWLLMQDDLRRYADLQSQIREAKLAREQFEQRVNNIRMQLPTVAQKATLQEISLQLDRLIQTNQEQLQKRQLNSQEEANIRKTLVRLIEQENQIEQQKMKIFAVVGVQDDQQFSAYLEQRAIDQSNELSAIAFEKQISPADRDKLTRYENQEQLLSQLKNAKGSVEQLEQNLRSEQELAQKCRLTIKSLVTDGSLSELEQERANLEAKIWQEVQEWLAYQLAAKWINKTLVFTSADRYPAIIKQAEEYFAILTDYRYTKIELTDDGVQVLSESQEVYMAEELSQGTAEQLYVALRLGFINVMKDQVNFPVMIDDGFVNFDDQRRRRMMKLLAKIAESNQVLYFTANSEFNVTDSHVLNLTNINIE